MVIERIRIGFEKRGVVLLVGSVWFDVERASVVGGPYGNDFNVPSLLSM